MAEIIKTPLRAALDEVAVLIKMVHTFVLDSDMEDILNAYYFSNNKSENDFLELHEALELRDYLNEIYSRFQTFSV